MYKQLVERYIDNCGCVNWYVQYASIKQQMDMALNQARTAYRNLQPEEKLFYFGYDKQEWPMFERLVVDFVNKENELQTAKIELKATKKELGKSRQRLEKYKNSKSYKIGRAVTWAPRKIARNHSK